MSSRLFDPNNHVPEVTPGDDWGDAEGCAPELPAAAMPTSLPPRRTVAVASPSESAPVGLRIDSTLTRAEAVESPKRLEVQEISGSVIRLEQSEDAPEKVARQVTFHERPVREDTGKKGRGEGRHWGIGRVTPTRWILAAGGAITAIVIVSMMLLPAINAPNAPRVDPNAVNSAAVIEEAIAGMETMNRLLVKQPEAMRIFQSFVSAVHHDEIVPLIRDGSALKETLRSHWKPLQISRQWVPAPESIWNVLDVDGKPCALLEGTFPDQKNFTAYFVSEGDRLLLDWKATTAFGTATFAELEKGTGDPGEIRGEISIAEFYNAVWPEADFQSFRLISPDNRTALWCYTRRGTRADGLLGNIFRRGEIIEEAQQSQKITLHLERGPDGAQPNQWLIAELLHSNWLNP